MSSGHTGASNPAGTSGTGSNYDSLSTGTSGYGSGSKDNYGSGNTSSTLGGPSSSTTANDVDPRIDSSRG